MIITNARIFTGQEFSIYNTVLVENGKIKDIYLDTHVHEGKNDYNADKNVIDAKGKILSPGLVDIHTHGCGGINSIEISSAEDIDTIRLAYAKEGTTSAVLTSFYSDKETKHLDVLVDYNSKNKPGASILGLYLEGPFISKKKKGMIPERYIRSGRSYKSVLAGMKKIMKKTKIITIAPEKTNSDKIIKTFKKEGIVTAFGHSEADYDKVISGIESGISHTTHLFNAMNPIHHRNPGPLLAIWENSNNPVELIADGMHIKPVVLKMVYELFGKDRVILVTDATGMRGLKPGHHYRKKLGRFILKNGLLFYEDHRIMGTNISLLTMCKRMKKWLQLKNEDVLQMATFNPHKLLGDKVGMIQKGYSADFILLDNQLNLHKTIVKGEVIK